MGAALLYSGEAVENMYIALVFAAMQSTDTVVWHAGHRNSVLGPQAPSLEPPVVPSTRSAHCFVARAAATSASVVSINGATDAAFCSATRTSFGGSITPARTNGAVTW